MKINVDKICVAPIDSLKKSLDRMAANKSNPGSLPSGIILVVDKNKKLLGIATDGDIRRALLQGHSLKTPIKVIMNSTPFLTEDSKNSTEILSSVVEKIRKERWHKDRLNKIIVVDKQRRVVNIISFYDLLQRGDVKFKRIGVLGLGYVGLTLALTLADLGFKVFGFDTNLQVRKSLQSGKPHFFENGLEQILKDHLNKNFKVVTNFSGVNSCDVYFIAVGTPLDFDNKPDLGFLKKASEHVGRSLKSGDLVILRSTVPIGVTRHFVIPILEKTSGLKAGDSFFVAFAPERTVEGKALEELRKLPQVIGGINKVSVDLTAAIFNRIVTATILVDSLEEAEIVKLVNNTYRDVTFAFANELSLVCHGFGIDTYRVIEAANRGYERSKIPLPSPGVGGACLEKDPFIFFESAKTKNYELLLAKHARHISNLMIDFVAQKIISFIKKNNSIKDPKVLILGFAFKGQPLTSDTRGSTAIHLVRKLKKNIKHISVYDPVVKRADVVCHGAHYVSKAEDGFSGVDVVVVMNNNPSFERLDIRRLLKVTSKPVFLFDTWGLYNRNDVLKVKGVEYARL